MADPSPPSVSGAARRLDDPSSVDDIVATAVEKVRGGVGSAPVPTPGQGPTDESVAPPIDDAPEAPLRRLPASLAAIAEPPADGLSASESAVGDAAPPTDDANAESDDDGSSRRRRYRGLVEWIVVIGGALVVAVLIKTFLFQAFYIPSASMTPTLGIGDRVLVNKLSYDLHEVNRGDLVVFERPEGERVNGGIKDLIKRVVGLPGERVEVRDSTVFIDGAPLDEPYLEDAVGYSGFGPIDVEPGHVFVMGDNRPSSRDSRYFGTVPAGDIIGRAFLRVWPPGRAGFL